MLHTHTSTLPTPVSLHADATDLLTPSQRLAGRGVAALAVIAEMLERLESVTRAGQQHLMGKIVTVLSVQPPTQADESIVAHRLAELRQESGKVAPDGQAFTLIARALLATLGAPRATR
jgi:hypothetical protein